MMKKITLLFVLTVFAFQFGNAQEIKNFDASSTWNGYMVWTGPSGGNGFGQVWDVPGLVAILDTGSNTVTLKPNRVNDTNSYWFADPNDFFGEKEMTASSYVVDDALAATAFNFIGNISSFDLDGAYSVVVYIKVFNGDYSAILFENSQAITSTGNFSIGYDGLAVGAVHVQYGFTMVGANVNPTAAFDVQYDALGSVVVEALIDPLTDTRLSDLQVDGVTIPDFSSGTLNYTYGYDAGTTEVPVITATTTNVDATTTINQASSIPGDATVLVTAKNGSTTATYTISFVEIIPNTDCAGFSTEASVGEFTNGYNYTVETLSGGTEVKYTIELLDVFPGLATPQLFAEPNVYINMVNTTGQIWEGTVSGLTNGDVISYVGRFVYAAGGVAHTKLLTYTVGDTCPTASIKDYEIEGLMAYPNPSNSKWTISTRDQEIQAIDVYNVLGKRVLSLKPNTLSVKVDASGLAPGVYITTITTEKGTSSRKLIKN